jgi:hypothetical protein
MYKYDKIYELSDSEYNEFYNSKKNDIAFILQILMSNISILINENINILSMFIEQNMSEQNELKSKFQNDFNELKRKLRSAQSFDQSTVVDKFYPIIIQNKNIILNLYDPLNPNENTVNIRKIFDFLTCDNNKHLKKLYSGLYWLFNKYNDKSNKSNKKNNINNAEKYIDGVLNGDDKTRIRIIINSIKNNFYNIKDVIIKSYDKIDNYIKIENTVDADHTKSLCEDIIKKSINDIEYQHMYLIIQIIKKLLLSYDDIYKNKHEFILFNVIVDELNNELIDVLSIDINNNNINMDSLINNIDTNILKIYNYILYDNLIKENVFGNNDINTDFIKNIFYDFLNEINMFDELKKYIDYYVDILLQLTLKCKLYINSFLQLNLRNIKSFNKNLYNLLIVSERYFNAKLHQ